jgi:hypothetical protein
LNTIEGARCVLRRLSERKATVIGDPLTPAEHRKLVVSALRALANHIEHTPGIEGFELRWKGGDDFAQVLLLRPAPPVEFIPISFVVAPVK